MRVIVHVPLDVPQALPGSRVAWYCTPSMQHVDTPLPTAWLAAYTRMLAAGGVVHDRFGFGTWAAGTRGTSDVAFEGDDHLEAAMPVHAARRVLPALLRRLRAQLQQREALGEMVGVADGTIGERRTAIAVTLPYDRADAARLEALHAIFGDGGNGGATQFDDARGVHVYSGVAPAAVARIEAALTRAGFAYTTQPETFVAVDAPAC